MGGQYWVLKEWFGLFGCHVWVLGVWWALLEVRFVSLVALLRLQDALAKRFRGNCQVSEGRFEFAFPAFRSQILIVFGTMASVPFKVFGSQNPMNL